MRARYYDAGTGYFLKEDPIGFEGGLNVSLYVGGNPVVGIDPSGFSSFLVTRPIQDRRTLGLVDHSFIVSNANSIGDPSATVASYATTDGILSGVTNATNTADIAAWNNLSPSDVGSVTWIPATDYDVEQAVTSFNTQ